MAEMKDSDHHLVRIPVNGDHQKQLISAIEDHPLTEISGSPGHLLLLKLLQREENISGRRIAGKETRLDTLRREVFQLCLLFFIFHGLFFTILFTSSNNSINNSNSNSNTNTDVDVCKQWWIPMITCVSFCLMMVFLVQMKLFDFWKVYGQIQREKTDNRGVTRCIQELRLKGVGFDLSKEPGNGKRIKSSSVEIKWKPISWCSKYFVTICLVSGSGLVIPVCKFMICD